MKKIQLLFITILCSFVTVTITYYLMMYEIITDPVTITLISLSAVGGVVWIIIKNPFSRYDWTQDVDEIGFNLAIRIMGAHCNYKTNNDKKENQKLCRQAMHYTRTSKVEFLVLLDCMKVLCIDNPANLSREVRQRIVYTLLLHERVKNLKLQGRT